MCADSFTDDQFALPIDAALRQVRVIQFAERHRHAFLALRRDLDVQQFTTNDPQALSDARLLEGFEQELISPSGYFMVEDLQSGAYVGECGLMSEVEDFLEVYCVLGKEWQRQGIGREVIAFLSAMVESKGMRPIGFVDPRNTASLGLLRSLGFEQIPNPSRNGNHATSLAFARTRQNMLVP
jgi:RimJ/RimL family protein N-acetyltransferase